MIRKLCLDGYKQHYRNHTLHLLLQEVCSETLFPKPTIEAPSKSIPLILTKAGNKATPEIIYAHMYL